MAHAHRAARSAGYYRRLALIGGLVLAVVAGTGGWASGLYDSSGSADSRWRTGWALSLDHAGTVDGPNLTCRLVARMSLAGTALRFRLINYPSTTSVRFSDLVAGVRTRGLSVDPATIRRVTVNGSTDVTLAPNGEVLTDPVPLPVRVGQDVTLSIAVASGVSAPFHFWTSVKSGCTPPGAGDKAASPSGESFAVRSEDRWLSEVRVLPASSVPTVAVYGDSLSDGLYLPVDADARWTDQLQAQTGGRLVALNFGVSGDLLTGWAPQGQLPPRLETDVLAPARLSAVVVEMGSNDIKGGVSARDILAEYALVAEAVKRAKATLIVATVPARADGLTPAAEQQRQLLNQGLRAYPIVADIDAALSDPDGEELRSTYDIGDHVHPNPAGVERIVSVMRAALARVPGALGAAAR